MSAANHLNLLPPLLESGKINEFIESGQTLSASLSPLDNSLAAFVSNAADLSVAPSQVAFYPEGQPIYFASMDSAPSSERRLFITDTLIIFAAFQNLMKTSRTQDPEWLHDEQCHTMIRKLAIDYVNFIKECWVHASQPISRPDGPLQFTSDHYRSLYTCFSLFVVLYLPENGLEDAPIGDELMEWLNIHFIEPSTEEGDHLSGLDQPWEDESFWPYLTRATLRGLSKASVFFLDVLSRHPSEDLQELTPRLILLLNDQPRLGNFSAERDFAYASRRWKDKIKALRIDLDGVPEDVRHDGFENWWDRLSDIVGILEGRGEVIQRICEELGADWKEVCAAWGVFVETRLRRQDLPHIVGQILHDMPPDPTNLEDRFHATLFSGHPTEALLHASLLDRWLSAHLADLMEPLSLIDDEINEESGLSTRDQYILSYAEYLHSDPALWQITTDYMYSCANVGKERADEILIRVPLRLHKQNEGVAQPGESEVATKIRAGDVAGVLQEVNRVCFEHQRERTRRTVCRIAAQTLVQEKEYGLAVSYCTSAEDWRGLGRVVDRVLDEYVTSGPAKFARYAADIAPSLQELQAQPGSHGIFIHRLMFAVRYAQFHHLLMKKELQDAALDLVAMFHDDMAPKSWWGVLLCDAVELLQSSTSLLFSTSGACELLQKLEEVHIGAAQGSGDDYLSILRRTTKGGGEKDALERLKTVRLALARYFARCTVVGVGGKQVVDKRSYALA